MSKKAKVILSVRDFFEKGNFVIPAYQRGYKWGVPTSKELDKCAVSILMDDLIAAAEQNKSEYYLQGVTVYEDNNNIYLIDGQQRTTTLYLLLKYLHHPSLPKIEYLIRKESDEFLNGSKIANENISYEKDYDLQDIFYFKKAVKTIHKKLEGKNTTAFAEYLLNQVKLFYITINPDQATKVFTMMNGNKAFMKADELIKSDILIKVSHNNKYAVNKDNNLTREDWEINALRSRYAREWDKWLYWWNREDVKEYFKSGNNPMGLLLEYFYYKENQEGAYKNDEKFAPDTYRKFKDKFLSGESNVIKNNFKKLRDLQKIFEEWYDNYEIYNYLKLAMIDANKKELLLYLLKLYITDKNNFIEKLIKLTELLITGIDLGIIEKNDSSTQGSINEIVNDTLNTLNAVDIYNNSYAKEMAFRQLLRMNIQKDTDLQRKFDFEIWRDRSLEHIHPKSKVYYEENEGINRRADTNEILADLLDKSYINKSDFEEGCSEHCIGNLVLLKKNENSQFSDADFATKKKIYFGDNVKWSLKLLHSVSIFSNEKWGVEDIKQNKEDFLKIFKNTYNEYLEKDIR